MHARNGLTMQKCTRVFMKFQSEQAVALVQARSVWQGPLTRLSEEEQHGYEYYRFPSDCFSLQIMFC